MSLLLLIAFVTGWFALIYIATCFLKRTFVKLDIKLSILYITFVAMFGPLGEIVVGSLYAAIFNHPLWQYHILPIHNGYTSLFAPFVWGIGGFYLYVVHEIARKQKSISKIKVSLIHMTEMICVEFLINLSFLLIFGSYIFYYQPGEMWHIVSVQTLPFYAAAGFVIATTIKRTRKDPMFFSIMFVGILGVIVYLTQ